MIENFFRAISFILSWEGYKSDDPDDPGKLTIWGISSKSHPEDVHRMVYMTEDKAKETAIGIYKTEYWDKLGCDNLPFPLDVVCMDTGVNMGISRALNFLTVAPDWRDYILYRIMRYVDLGKANPKFLRGWLNRTISLWKMVK